MMKSHIVGNRRDCCAVLKMLFLVIKKSTEEVPIIYVYFVRENQFRISFIQ
jgi:hypothetical protein